MNALEFLIIDEIHALANKRGVHLSLSVERLQQENLMEMTRIGLSATISPLDEIAKFLHKTKTKDIGLFDWFGGRRNRRIARKLLALDVRGDE